MDQSISTASVLLLFFVLSVFCFAFSCTTQTAGGEAQSILSPITRNRGTRSADSLQYILGKYQLPISLYFAHRKLDPYSMSFDPHSVRARNFGDEFPDLTTELFEEVKMHHSAEVLDQNKKPLSSRHASSFLALHMTLFDVKKYIARHSEENTPSVKFETIGANEHGIDKNWSLYKVDTYQLAARGGKIINAEKVCADALDSLGGEYDWKMEAGDYLVWGEIPREVLTAIQANSYDENTLPGKIKREREEKRVQFRGFTEEIQHSPMRPFDESEMLDKDVVRQTPLPNRSRRPTWKRRDNLEADSSLKNVTHRRSNSRPATERKSLREKSDNLPTPKKQAKPTVPATKMNPYSGIEDILAHEPVDCGEEDAEQYLVEWKGKHEDTWVPKEDIDAVDLIATYWANLQLLPRNTKD